MRVVVEVEESGFLPTKLCGTFLQVELSDAFISAGQDEGFPVAAPLWFVQVLDASNWKSRSGKKEQAQSISRWINELPAKRHKTVHKLFTLKGDTDQQGQMDLEAYIRKVCSGFTEGA